LVKSAIALCGSGFWDSQLKVVSIDYFFLMKKRLWHAQFALAEGFKNGVSKTASNVIVVLIVITILSF
jgi:hypothetical protein